ncbi:MAG: hypothetical protein H7240_00650 [Glaciimonas sp.]|nr:hypothetical protein [Glaciimonas sp.]
MNGKNRSQSQFKVNGVIGRHAASRLRTPSLDKAVCIEEWRCANPGEITLDIIGTDVSVDQAGILTFVQNAATDKVL